MTSAHTIDSLLQASAVHPEWREPLASALQAVDGDYLEQLLAHDHWLPGADKLLRAFQRDRKTCRYILFGESPYPRAASANGIAFYDAAVSDLWSDQGLSTAVNRATSLRNIIKTALLAEGLITADAQGKISQQAIAALDKTRLIENIGQLFDTLQARGFLLFNATPVLHAQRKPAQEARFWRPFMAALLAQLAAEPTPPTLVLWGKIAEQIRALPKASAFTQLRSEHPYNISFIHNKTMQQLFAELQLLQKTTSTDNNKPVTSPIWS